MIERHNGSLRLIKGRASAHIPHDWESERAVLGGIMSDPGLFKDVQSECGLTRDDFHKPCHQLLWDLMGTVDIPDFLSVISYASQSNDRGELLGGIGYLSALPNACPSVSGVIPRARALRTITIRRALSAVAETIREISTDIVAGSDEMLTKAREAIDATSGLRSNRTWVNAVDASSQTLLTIQNRMSKDGPEGIDFGWPTMTRLLGRLRPGKLWVICARPAMGKSSLANMLALKAAAQGYGVGFVSLEMDVAECTERSLVQLSKVDAAKLRDGKLTHDDQMNVFGGADYFGQMNFWIEYAPGLTMTRLRGMAYQLRAEAQSKGTVLGLLVVDYLQLMGGQTNGQSNNDFFGGITKGCKILAGELDIPIVVLSQLNRNLETRTDKRPVMSDIRDSGSIEQDADVIIGIDRPEYWNPTDRPGEADIVIMKARGGSTGVIAVEWKGAQLTFGDEVQQPFYG